LWSKELPEITTRFTKVVSGVSKSEARQLIRNNDLGLTVEQAEKVLVQLSKGRVDKVSIKIINTGEVRLSTERAGAVSGYQRMSFEIDTQGNTNKVVQTAFDNNNVLVRQSPGEIKNNLYDVKKWNVPTY